MDARFELLDRFAPESAQAASRAVTVTEFVADRYEAGWAKKPEVKSGAVWLFVLVAFVMLKGK